MRCSPKGYAASCHAVGQVDWLGELHRVKCPALVIAGALDVGAPVAMSEAIAQRISGSELVVVDGAAHLNVTEQPAAFSSALDTFLARIG